MYKRGERVPKMRQNLIAGVLIVSLFAPFLFQDAAATSARQTGPPILTQSNKISVQRERGQGEIEVAKKIDYALPYPGILPDHLLYPLKVFRDRILEFLIRDQLRKIDFYLLMADKRLNMGVFLTDKNKPELAETTVSKGEKYFLKGVEQLENVSRSDTISLPGDTVAKYKTASLKHQEVIEELKKNAPESLKQGYNSSLSLVEKIQASLTVVGND